MSRKVIGGIAILAAAAIAMMALTQETETIDAAGNPAPHKLLGWDEIVADARHSWFWTQIADPYSASMIDASLWMYQITGDEFYIDYIKSGFGDAPLEGTDRRLAVTFLARLAVVDRSYVGQVSKTADAMMKEEIDSGTNLFYASDGRKEMYVPYDGAQGIEALLLVYEATSDEKYLTQAKKTIYAVWDVRDRDTNLVPGWF